MFGMRPQAVISQEAVVLLLLKLMGQVWVERLG